MDWAAIMTTLPEVIRDISGGLDVDWINRRSKSRARGGGRGSKQPIGWVTLEVLTNVAHGRDETRYEVLDGDDAGKLQERLTGPRTLTITVRAEVLSQELERSADQVMSDIRTRLQRRDIRQRLRAAGLGGVRSSPVRKADFAHPHTGRMHSVGLIDVSFITAVRDVGAKVDCIETVTIGEHSGGTIVGPTVDGVTLDPIVVPSD